MSERDVLADLVPRVVDDPDFVAWALAEYRRIEGISEERLRELLNIDHRTYLRLSFCAMPSNDPKHFRRHVQEISTHTGIDTGILANLFRQVAALATLPKRSVQGAAPQAQGATDPAPVRKRHFMAARDHREMHNNLAEESVVYSMKSQAAYTSAKDSEAEDSEAETSKDEDSKDESRQQAESDTPTDPAQPGSAPATKKILR